MAIIWKNALLLFGVTFISDAVIGNLLYMNPLVAGIYSKLAGHPGMKPWQTFGSIGNFIMLNMAMGILMSAVYVALFSLVRGRLPRPWFLAGLYFGSLVIFMKAVPEAWNQYLNINYPVKLVVTQFINSSIGILASGTILGLAWNKWPTIR